MANVFLSFLALTFTLEDVTLENGVRVIVSPGPPAVAVAPDRSVVVVIGEGTPAAYAAWPRPSPRPPVLGPMLGDGWHIESGPPTLVMQWMVVPPEETLLLTALLGPLERDVTVLRLTVKGGWPPDERRRFDAELERLATLAPRELPAVKEACSAFATPRTSAERAQRLLQVTLATGNPRLYRELSDRCARLTVANVRAAAKMLYRQPIRIWLKTPVEPGTVDP